MLAAGVTRRGPNAPQLPLQERHRPGTHQGPAGQAHMSVHLQTAANVSCWNTPSDAHVWCCGTRVTRQHFRHAVTLDSHYFHWRSHWLFIKFSRVNYLLLFHVIMCALMLYCTSLAFEFMFLNCLPISSQCIENSLPLLSILRPCWLFFMINCWMFDNLMQCNTWSFSEYNYFRVSVPMVIPLSAIDRP